LTTANGEVHEGAGPNRDPIVDARPEALLKAVRCRTVCNGGRLKGGGWFSSETRHHLSADADAIHPVNEWLGGAE
jgi:hypothetical protein